MKLTTKLLASSIATLFLLVIFLVILFLLLHDLRQASIRQQFAYTISEISFQQLQSRSDYVLYQSKEAEKKLIEAANMLSVTLDAAAPFFHDTESKVLFDDVYKISLEIKDMRVALFESIDQGGSKEAIKQLSESLGIKSQQRVSNVSNLLAASKKESEHSLFLLELSAVIFGFLLLCVAFISYWITKIVVFKVRIISSGTKIVAGGNLEYQLPVRSSDELGMLASSFNTMMLKLRDSYADIEHRVQKRTAELAEKQKILKD